jgi:hypothetical protein
VIITRTTTVAVDDIYAANGQKIEAYDTAYIWWDDAWHELHLTKSNMARLSKVLGPFLNVARKSKGPEKLRPRAAPKRHYRPRRDWAGFKAWCDSAGRTYVSASGHWSPKARDIKDYEKWLADNPASAPKGNSHAEQRRDQPASDSAHSGAAAAQPAA